MNTIKLEVAIETDAREIRDLMIRVEEHERNLWYEGDERPFIPGFDSVDMQKYHMWNKKYYKIMVDNLLAGVLLISYTGREHARIDRLYIDPSFQNKRIGSQVLNQIEELHPEVSVWTLDTIQKSVRNHYFYEKNGYEMIAEDSEERYYQKKIESTTKVDNEYQVNMNFQNYNFRECNMENSDFYSVNLKNTAISNATLEASVFQNINFRKVRITNANMSHSVIGDSNLNQIEVCHVSLGGATIHDTNLGFQKESKPLTVERCDLNNSIINNSNLQNVTITNCDIEGLTIDGIDVSVLIDAYKGKNVNKNTDQ